MDFFLALSPVSKTFFFFLGIVSALVTEQRRANFGYMLAWRGYKYQIALSIGKGSRVHPELKDYPIHFYRME